MRKKIVHIINSMAMGGAETLLANSLAPGGLQDIADNTLIYFQGESALLERLDKNVQQLCLDYRGYVKLPQTITKLRKWLQEIKPDVVHSHLNPAGLYTHWACPPAIPQVHTLHTTYSMDKETGWLKRMLEKQFYFRQKNCNLVFLSEYTRNDFMQQVPFRGKSFVLNNFVPDIFFKDTAKLYNPEKKELKLIAVGRLSPVKNFEYLLDVFSLLKDKPVYLDIYGAGDAGPYQQRIDAENLQVRMMGPCNDIAAVLPAYDCFIMPSRFEGFPLSPFEAMAGGLPLLVSDIAPLRSIIHEHAVYFPLDQPQQLADILLDILTGKRGIRKLAQDGLQYANQTVRRKKYTETLLRIYEDLAPARPAR